jgi:hypothetical protein
MEPELIRGEISGVRPGQELCSGYCFVFSVEYDIHRVVRDLFTKGLIGCEYRTAKQKNNQYTC